MVERRADALSDRLVLALSQTDEGVVGARCLAPWRATCLLHARAKDPLRPDGTALSARSAPPGRPEKPRGLANWAGLLSTALSSGAFPGNVSYWARFAISIPPSSRGEGI